MSEIELESDTPDATDLPKITLEILANAFAWLAVATGEKPEAVVRDLKRDTALARTIRKALMRTTNDVPARSKPGRPRKDYDREMDRLVVSFLRQPEWVLPTGMCANSDRPPADAYYLKQKTIDEVIGRARDIRHAQGRRGRDGRKLSEDGLKTSIKRAKTSSKLGDLFVTDAVLAPEFKIP